MPTKEQKNAKTGAPKDPRDVNFQSRKRSKHDKTRGFGMHRWTQKTKIALQSGRKRLKNRANFGRTIPKSRKLQKTHEETINLHENREKTSRETPEKQNRLNKSQKTHEEMHMQIAFS